MCGHGHFCYFWIVCEIFQQFQKVSQMFVRISIVIPIFILVFGYVVCLTPISCGRFVTSL